MFISGGILCVVVIRLNRRVIRIKRKLLKKKTTNIGFGVLCSNEETIHVEGIQTRDGNNDCASFVSSTLCGVASYDDKSLVDTI